MGTAGTDTHANNNTDASINAKVTCTDTLHSEDEAHAAHEANPWLFLKPPANEIPSVSHSHSLYMSIIHPIKHSSNQPIDRSLDQSINQTTVNQSKQTNSQSVNQSSE